MFDMSHIVEKISGLFENKVSISAAGTEKLSDLVQDANIDLSALENASNDQLGALISHAGISPDNLTDDQILETAQDVIQSGVLELLKLDHAAETFERQ